MKSFIRYFLIIPTTLLISCSISPPAVAFSDSCEGKFAKPAALTLEQLVLSAKALRTSARSTQPQERAGYIREQA